MIKQAIKQVVMGNHLTENEAQDVMLQIMEGKASSAQIGALLTALQLKGETVQEITGFARAMRQVVTPVISNHSLIVDTCGTGGDGSNTFNISTTAALVLAGAGAKVAKHGNRSISSRSGSADVLEKLGVNLQLTPEQAGQCLDEIGICFLYAPQLHTAMKYAAGPRKEIGIRTAFNILGPLTNPAGAQVQVLGVYSMNLVTKLAQALACLGSKRAFVLHGSGGLDEFSLAGVTEICEVRDGQVHNYQLDPRDYGINTAPVEALVGGTPEENARITIDVLAGTKGHQRDAVVLNAALGLMGVGLAEDMTSGIQLAQNTIDSGAAAAKLAEFVEFTSSLSSEGVVSF